VAFDSTVTSDVSWTSLTNASGTTLTIVTTYVRPRYYRRSTPFYRRSPAKRVRLEVAANVPPPAELEERLYFRERRVGRAIESRYRVMLC
jgi:hypothetical protein